MKIKINGDTFDVNGEQISYEDVLRLARISDGASITYYVRGNEDNYRSGILFRNNPIKIQDGMIFSVAHTGNA